MYNYLEEKSYGKAILKVIEAFKTNVALINMVATNKYSTEQIEAMSNVIFSHAKMIMACEAAVEFINNSMDI